MLAARHDDDDDDCFNIITVEFVKFIVITS